MAISKVSQYNSTPTVVADYQAQNAHLQAMINQANGSVGILTQATIGTIPSIKQGTYISFGGVLYIVDTEDYTILGTAIAGDNYIRLEASGDNLTATWVQTITSYAWNSVYNYYTDGTYVLLPYIVNYATNYYIAQFDQNFNQTLKKEDDVIFNDIHGNGDFSVTGAEKARTAGSYTLPYSVTGSTGNSAYTLLGSIKVKMSGILTTYLGVRTSNGTSQAILYKNGVSWGTERSTSSTTYVYYSENMTVEAGDVIQLYGKSPDYTCTATLSLKCDEEGTL